MHPSFLLPPSRYYEASDRARRFGAPTNAANASGASKGALEGASKGRRSPSGRALNDIGGDHASPAEIVLDAADKIRFDAVEEMKGRGKKSDDIAVIVVTMNRFWESEIERRQDDIKRIREEEGGWAACPKCTALNPGVGAGGVGAGAVGSGIVCYRCGATFTGGEG